MDFRAVDKSCLSVRFEGAEGMHFDDAISGCIVFDLREIDRAAYIQEDKQYIDQRAKHSYPSAIDKVIAEQVRVWELTSSYGLCGFIIAASCSVSAE